MSVAIGWLHFLILKLCWLLIFNIGFFRPLPGTEASLGSNDNSTHLKCGVNKTLNRAYSEITFDFPIRFLNDPNRDSAKIRFDNQRAQTNMHEPQSLLAPTYYFSILDFFALNTAVPEASLDPTWKPTRPKKHTRVQAAVAACRIFLYIIIFEIRHDHALMQVGTDLMPNARKKNAMLYRVRVAEAPTILW